MTLQLASNISHFAHIFDFVNDPTTWARDDELVSLLAQDIFYGEESEAG